MDGSVTGLQKKPTVARPPLSLRYRTPGETLVGRGGERVTRRRRRWGVAAPWRWILSGSTGWIAGHVDTEGLYFEISLLSLPQICCFFAYILSLKSRQHSCRGKWVLFRVEKGHPHHTPPPSALSLFSPLWEEVKRRRQDQLLWCVDVGFQLCPAHVRCM